jgi:hypothetical protein
MEAFHFIMLSRRYITTEPEACAMWRGVVLNLNLSAEQRALVLQWHKQYLQDLETIRQQGFSSGADLLNCLPQVRTCTALQMHCCWPCDRSWEAPCACNTPACL